MVYRTGQDVPIVGGKDVGLTADSRYGEGWPRRTTDSAIQAVGNSLLRSQMLDDVPQVLPQGTRPAGVPEGA